MYSSYIPFYRGFGYPGYGMGFPGFGIGYPGYGIGYPGYGFGTTSFGANIVGSAIANQSLINTGTATGITQTATPTVIW